MAVAARTSQMSVEEFEEIARGAPETVRLEFLHGQLGVKAVPDGNRSEIVRWVAKRLLREHPGLWMYQARGLRVEAYRQGRALPDGVLAPDGSFAGHGEWAEPDRVVMAVEVASHDPDDERRYRVDKPDAYAQTGIAVYLLIDPDAGETFVFSRPENGIYTAIGRHPFGKIVELPAPLEMTLETEPLKRWVR